MATLVLCDVKARCETADESEAEGGGAGATWPVCCVGAECVVCAVRGGDPDRPGGGAREAETRPAVT